MQRKTFDRYWEANVRARNIVWPPACISDARPDGALEHLQESILDGSKIHGLAIPLLSAERAEDHEELQEWMFINNLEVFFVEIETPVVDAGSVRLDEKGNYSSNMYSWGYTTSRWFYAPSVKGAMAAGLRWARARHKNAVQQARALHREAASAAKQARAANLDSSASRA